MSEVLIKVTRYLTDSTIVDSYSQHEWINKESVLPRIEIPVSDHHHSLFHAAKRIVRLQVSSEEGKESRRLVLTSLIKVKFHVVFVS